MADAERPVHIAYLEGKVPCPNPMCNDFYKKEGLSHHYRIKHPEAKYEENVQREADIIMKKLHGQETRKVIEKMLETQQVQYIIFHIHAR